MVADCNDSQNVISSNTLKSKLEFEIDFDFKKKKKNANLLKQWQSPEAVVQKAQEVKSIKKKFNSLICYENYD